MAEALRAKGWEVRTQIGVSGFRVDLGVVHPDFAGSYLAGVECDGTRYHSSATARDRDKLRQAVLEGLGWTILRIWSTDWFRNPLIVAERVHVELERLLEEDREARTTAGSESEGEVKGDESPVEPDGAPQASEPESSVSEVEPVVHPAELSSESDLDWARLRAHSEARYNPAGTGGPEIPPGGGNTTEPNELGEQVSLDEGASPPSSPESESESPDGIVADPARFFDYAYTLPLRRMILSIVEREGPMPLHRLARRVAQEHGWQRTGKRIRERVEKNLGQVESHPESGAMFVWAPSSHSDRVPFRGMNDRSIRDVSRAEIASVIDAHSGELASAEDPTLLLSRFLGISRLSQDARAYLTECARWREQNAIAGNE